MYITRSNTLSITRKQTENWDTIIKHVTKLTH